MSDFRSLSVVTGMYRVTLVDTEPVEVKIIGADILRWEQVNNKSFFEGAIGLSRMAWIAWAAMTRNKLTELTIAEFMARLEEVEQQEDPEEESGEEEEDQGVPLPPPTEADGVVW